MDNEDRNDEGIAAALATAAEDHAIHKAAQAVIQAAKKQDGSPYYEMADVVLQGHMQDQVADVQWEARLGFDAVAFADTPLEALQALAEMLNQQRKER